MALGRFRLERVIVEQANRSATTGVGIAVCDENDGQPSRSAVPRSAGPVITPVQFSNAFAALQNDDEEIKNEEEVLKTPRYGNAEPTISAKKEGINNDADSDVQNKSMEVILETGLIS